ncbi:C40 family peptidase [Corynebacterium choanae]|uniref:C40 family peptidase n=1 Tax=Corynebacterium choanae TaxID=1862358 RepID=UPI003617638E
MSELPPTIDPIAEVTSLITAIGQQAANTQLPAVDFPSLPQEAATLAHMTGAEPTLLTAACTRLQEVGDQINHINAGCHDHLAVFISSLDRLADKLNQQVAHIQGLHTIYGSMFPVAELLRTVAATAAETVAAIEHQFHETLTPLTIALRQVQTECQDIAALLRNHHAKGIPIPDVNTDTALAAAVAVRSALRVPDSPIATDQASTAALTQAASVINEPLRTIAAPVAAGFTAVPTGLLRSLAIPPQTLQPLAAMVTPASAADVPTSSPTAVGTATEEQRRRGQQAANAALSAVGTPYQWGGNTPGKGLDCSGLTKWAWAQAGVDIPRLAQHQTVGSPVAFHAMIPGDLLVWDGHVAMYVGNGQLVEAGNPVSVSPVRTTNSGMKFYGCFRPTG